MLWKTLLDYSGASLSFLATIAFIRASVAAWPLSLLACSINLILYFRVGIYADTALEIFFFFSTFYGWYQWLRGSVLRSQLAITSLSFPTMLRLFVMALLGIAIIYFLLSNYTDSRIPFWDASTAVLCVIAQWLTCKKIMQNWILWFLVDSIYAGIYLYKGIPVHALLQGIYLVMAVVGYYNWRKICATNILLNC